MTDEKKTGAELMADMQATARAAVVDLESELAAVNAKLDEFSKEKIRIVSDLRSAQRMLDAASPPKKRGPRKKPELKAAE
jgi:hypothetical protein